jgi:hypothetical protein
VNGDLAASAMPAALFITLRYKIKSGGRKSLKTEFLRNKSLGSGTAAACLYCSNKIHYSCMGFLFRYRD